MFTTQDGTAAELQRTIAELRQALSERDAALAQRNSEFGERIEHQTTTIEVLKAMSASPDDAQPVFDLIARQAAKLCSVPTAAVATFDGTMIHLATQSGFDPAYADAYVSQFPRPLDRDLAMGRAILNRRVEQVEDITAYQGHSFVDVLGHWSVMAVPILRNDVPLGAITIGRPAMGPFSNSQVVLLQTFAEQAAIAISSAETYRALRTRTVDLQESLEYQTATSDVLKVISRSTFDLHPVLNTLIQTATRLCDAEVGVITSREANGYRVTATFSMNTEYRSFLLGRLLPVIRGNMAGRTALEGRIVHIADIEADPEWTLHEATTLEKVRTVLGVPLLREGVVAGTINLARRVVRPFTDKQIELVSTFAAQAVIAIENTRLLTEQQEALEQQTATSEVLQVINESPGNLAPVFDAVLEKAIRLCASAFGILATYDGHIMRYVAMRGLTPEQEALLADRPLAAGQPTGRIGDGENVVHLSDARDQDGYRAGFNPTRDFVDQVGARTAMWVALRKDKELLGILTIFRREVRVFTDKEVALVQNFAAQAVIAMENARLLNEQREALEQQTATAEVLQVINASPGNLAPVFDTILEKAMRLCGAAFGCMYTYDGKRFPIAAMHGVPDALADFITTQPPLLPSPGGKVERVLATKRAVQILDLAGDDMYLTGDVDVHAYVDLGGARTIVDWPLLREGSVVGLIAIYRQEVRAFSEKEVALLENFAAQAVIAMESARLLNALRARTDELSQRQAELRVTFENMGDGVAMFDETQHLVAWNRKFQDILDVPDDIIARRQTFSEYVRYLAQRGEYDAGADPEEQVRRLIEQAGQARTYERSRPDGRVIEIRHNPVAGGGFVLIYADITERKRSEAEIRAARDAAEEASRTIDAAFRELKAAQANLIQAEKMASLGQLTAGIAHEIKNPLNFVNNFSALSTELIDELREVLASAPLGDTTRAEVDDLTGLLKGNLEKVVQHGQRADGIVRAMLEHSRGSSAERRMVDLNALIDEALNLAYHGARAQDQSFDIALERNFGEGIAPIEVNPQDMTRVFLNLFSNGFYAATKRAHNGGNVGFVPMLKVTTRDTGEAVEIRVRDNGTGIPPEIMDKLFQPFFTTKPTGEGTGLGLSITYDIVTKQHGGTITVDSEVDAFTEFVVILPRKIFANGGSRA